MILINRREEVSWLDKAFHSPKAEFGVVYGRRRTGKTFLVKNFIKDKRHFYFLAKQENILLEFSRFKEKFAKLYSWQNSPKKKFRTSLKSWIPGT